MAGRLHVRIEGSLGVNNVEQWSIGVNYGLPGGSGQGDQALVQALADDLASYLATATAPAAAYAEMSSDAIIRGVSVYGYNSAGPAAAGGEATLATAKAGAGSISKPFQTSRVISLVTGLPGARHRGRFYVPALAASISAAGTSAPPGGYLTAWALILEQVTNLWGGSAPATLGVYSAVADTVTPVTSLRVGNVLDTQRRRRDAVPETFTVLAY